MRYLVLVIALLFYLPTSVIADSQDVTSGGFAKAAYRSYRICLTADTQNLVQELIFADTGWDGGGCTVDPSRNCAGNYCQKSPFCQGSWHETNARITRNMIYSMIGHYEKIDYTGIIGVPNYYPIPGIAGNYDVKPYRPGHPNHLPCDLIMFPGDMQAWGDADTNPPTARDNSEWARVASNMLDILEEYNIPWMSVPGNHDNKVKYAQVINAYMAASPYHHATAADGLSHALLIPTRIGKSLCVLGLQDDQVDGVADDAFRLANVGCSGGYPTIVMAHNMVASTQAVCSTVINFLLTGGLNIPAAGNEEIFLALAGHGVNSSGIDQCMARVNPPLWAGTPNLYLVNNNVQESTRSYDSPQSIPYGATPADNCGGLYSVITIDPEADRIDIHHYNPYFNSTETNNVCGYNATSFTEAFDFDARYP